MLIESWRCFKQSSRSSVWCTIY